MPISQEQTDLSTFFDSLNASELRRVSEILGTASETLQGMATGSILYDEWAASRFFGLTGGEVGRELFAAAGNKCMVFFGVGARLRARYEAKRDKERS